MIPKFFKIPKFFEAKFFEAQCQAPGELVGRVGVMLEITERGFSCQ
jgi:hypothetical protein